MATNTSFEDRLARLAEKTPTDKPEMTSQRDPFPFGQLVTRVVLPMCGLVVLAGAIFVVGASEDRNEYRQSPFDLAGRIKSNMTEAEIDRMNASESINKAATMAPTEGSAEMVRLLLSH